jgi:glutaconate CoA-transferase, subunit A
LKISRNKVVDLKEAIGAFVKEGSHVSIGGFTVSRAPMAAVFEIIRQRIKKLHIYVHSAGPAIDDLIGAGCVEKIELAYSGNGRFAPTGIRFKKAVQNKQIRVEDYSNYQMTLRFMAGAMGLPFLPVKSAFGTDILEKWGFPKDLREADPGIPDDKLKVIDNPFPGWCGTEKLVAVPAIHPDVTLIHAQKADAQGTVRIQGLTYADIEQAKSAKHLIVTCEEIVDADELRKDPDTNTLPHFLTDAVCRVPFGAFPTACYYYYDYDADFLTRHEMFAKNDARYEAYLQKYILETADHREFLDLIGPAALDKIKADPRTGYATGMNRSK